MGDYVALRQVERSTWEANQRRATTTVLHVVIPRPEAPSAAEGSTERRDVARQLFLLLPDFSSLTVGLLWSIPFRFQVSAQELG